MEVIASHFAFKKLINKNLFISAATLTQVDATPWNMEQTLTMHTYNACCYMHLFLIEKISFAVILIVSLYVTSLYVT